MIRSNGFVFSSDGVDFVSGQIDEFGNLTLAFHCEEEFDFTPEEVRELAAALFQLASEVEAVAVKQPPEGFFPEDPQPKEPQQKEDPATKLQRLLAF